MHRPYKELPAHGMTKPALFEKLSESKEFDADWLHGKTWGLVYFAGEEHTETISEAYRMFFCENGLGPAAFPSLKRFETEVVSILLSLLNAGEDGAGTMTSGGTESILLAVKAYLDYYKERSPKVEHPEMIVPVSAHPAFFKAADYLGIKAVPVSIGENFRADPDLVERSITNNTILVVASAPSFAQGVVDPIADLGEIAVRHGLGLHIDACLGAFILPFMKTLGHPVPPFDFSTKGVTSMSADLHKYGYAAKGASAVLYASRELRRHQFFVKADWPGGLYSSPTMLGTRPGGAIAAAWAALMSLGVSGYSALVKQALENAHRLMEGIEAIPELEVVGDPDMTVFSFTSARHDIFAIADRMAGRNWTLNRMVRPPSLHMIVTPNHGQSLESFIEDLDISVKEEAVDPRRNTEQVFATLYGARSERIALEDLKAFLIKRLEENYEIFSDVP